MSSVALVARELRRVLIRWLFKRRTMRTKRKDNANFVITRGNDYIVVEQSAIIVETWSGANCQRATLRF